MTTPRLLPAQLREGLALFPVVLLCSTLLGCIGATPLPQRIKTVQGPELKHLDMTFLQAGQTQRAEVLEKLAAIDAQVDSRKFFVGRWSTSKWGTWVILCGYISCAGGAGRLWSVANLLIEFDGDRVKTFEVFPDHELAGRLAVVAASDDPIDFTQPREITLLPAPGSSGQSAVYPCGKITLSKDAFDFAEGCGAKKPRDFTIEHSKVLRVTTPRFSAVDAQASSPVIHFQEKVKAGTIGSRRQMTVQMSVPDLVVLLKYVGQKQ